MPAASLTRSHTANCDHRSNRGFETWDDGRLLINPRFAEILQVNGLTTGAAFLAWRAGETVRHIGARQTTRITLAGPEGPETFFLKRHGPPGWKERIVPLLRFAPPILGARNEWDAIQRFGEAGIPTMTPVAYGFQGSHSFLMTQALPARCNLLELAEDNARNRPGSRPDDSPQIEVRTLVPQIAEIARRMHAAGLHHQDFYLNHMLLCDTDDIRVIDLGRVRQHRRLGKRWIVKDLAQLDFSARSLTCRDRLRFLRLYLGRPLNRGDRSMIRQIAFKSRRIAAHTAKHKL